jgi:calcineurin-like phosphoesterase family protein
MTLEEVKLDPGWLDRQIKEARKKTNMNTDGAKSNFGNGNWFFIADTHFGHGNIIKYCKRPFMSFEEEQMLEMIENGTIPQNDLRVSEDTIKKHDQTILESINSVVRQNDVLVIQGDFCFAKEDMAKKYRDGIMCKNVILIWGNHDHSEIGHLFSKTYHQYLFNVGGQKIFCSHYPCRSWDRSTHGSWMLYGHVHDALNAEDNGGVLPEKKKILESGFEGVLSKYGFSNKDAIDELIGVCSSLNGHSLTLDVGVDNRIRGEDVPFGTPWSMKEIREYMSKKR